MTDSRTVPSAWQVHDFLVGILGGGGLGAVVGVFVAARLVDNNLVMAAGAVIGALIGILIMMQTRRNNEGFWTVTVVVMWIVAVASVAFLVFLYDAIRNFS